MTISKTIASNFRHAYVYINDWSKSLPIDQRIQAFTVIAFSIVTPLVYYRKEIQVKLFDGTSAIRSFLRNNKDLPGSVTELTENLLEEIMAKDPSKEKNENFDYDKIYSPQEWLTLLSGGKLNNEQLLKAAMRLRPSPEPNPSTIRTMEDRFRSFFGDMANWIHQVIGGIDESLSLTEVVKKIGEQPKVPAAILLNCITWIACQQLIYPFVEQIKESEGLQLRTFTKLSIAGTSFFIFYHLMYHELPAGVKDVGKSLATGKGDYQALDNYPSWNKKKPYKLIAETILSNFFLTKSIKPAVILSTQDHNEGGMDSNALPECFAEMEETGSSELIRLPYRTLRVNVETLFIHAMKDLGEFQRLWIKRVQNQKGNVVIHLDNFHCLYPEHVLNGTEPSGPIEPSPYDLKICRGIIFESIRERKVNCVITATEKLREIMLEEKEDLFASHIVYRMEPDVAINFLKNRYLNSDRWDTPRINEKAINILMETIERYQITHALPNVLRILADKSIQEATNDRLSLQVQFPEDKESLDLIGRTIGRRLDQARKLKESLFKQLCNLQKRIDNKQDPRLLKTAKELLFVGHVLIPMIFGEIEQKLCKLENIPFYIGLEPLITKLQQKYKCLVYPAFENELNQWRSLPKELSAEFKGREEQIQAICEPLERRRTVNLRRDKPISMFLFGPPGTGKSTCAKAVAEKSYQIINVEEDPDENQAENVLRISLPSVSWESHLLIDDFFEVIYSFIIECPTATVILEDAHDVPDSVWGKILNLLDGIPIKTKKGLQVRRGDVTFIFTSNDLADKLRKPLEEKANNNDENTQAKQFQEYQKLLENEWKNSEKKEQRSIFSKEALLSRLSAIVPFPELSKKSNDEYIEEFLLKQQRSYSHHEIEIDFPEQNSLVQFFAKVIGDDTLRKMDEKIEAEIFKLFRGRISELKQSKVGIYVVEDHLEIKVLGKSSSSDKEEKHEDI